ncbi:hypothetical protein B0H12DRAFT_1226433 [Mycena haematopus]|nr:hypothetical protein B0H12DRAFT_1226433 [Mycena haematopus]
MPTLSKYFPVLSAISQLPQLSFATWTPGKAAQINFYVGGTCAQYTSQVASLWTSSPLVGGNGATTGAECFALGMPGDSTGINTAMMWEESTTSDTVEPAQANGWCMFWDGFNCTGNQVSSVYVPAGPGGGPCESGRSKDGFLWKTLNNYYLNVPIHYIFVNLNHPHFPNLAIQHLTLTLEVALNANIDLVISCLLYHIWLSIAARRFIEPLGELGICLAATTINCS